jgi:ArsR family transcriptional regulator
LGEKQSIIIILTGYYLKVAGMEQKFNNPKKIVLETDEEIQTDIEALLEGDEDIERASRSLKAMSHPLRLKILCTLGDQEVSVQEIVEQVGTSQSNISQHLAILRDKGILASRKDANRVFYRVSDSRTLQLIGMMRNVFCQQHH